MEHVAIGNGALGESDIEGKAATGSGERAGRERVSNERERMSQHGVLGSRRLDGPTAEVGGKRAGLPRRSLGEGGSERIKCFTTAAVDEANSGQNPVICRHFAAKDLLAKFPSRSVSG